jgi:hypothetical protein
VFVWNGVNERWGRVAARAREDGATVFVMERGFFDRFRHTQIDHEGFGHAASWASRLHEQAPACGADRFRRAWGGNPSPMRARQGYLLVLLQVPNDGQLRNSEMAHPAELVAAAEAAAPPEMDVCVRMHPLGDWRWTGNRSRPITGSLVEAVQGAAFCVTVNSNAGNEALAMGCPVLCFGPALYAIAGVAMQTHQYNLARRIVWMLDQQFDDGRVRNYLHHLACRQWTRPELVEGAVLKELIDASAGE